MSFKVEKQIAHGGDVQMYKIDKLPIGAKILSEIGDLIIARGEVSGHSHCLTGDVVLFELDGQKFACVGSDGAYHQHIKESDITPEIFKINKNISNCDHTKDCKIPEGIYALGLDRQYDPHEELWVKNND